jgi:hypothetical protein
MDSSDDDIEKFTGDIGRNMAAFMRKKNEMMLRNILSLEE